MASFSDPYRTLGLDRGAALDEVKRAYRRLAKANHPDKAGEAALPRFLAIQAAYDLIVGPDNGIRSTGRTPTDPAPWEADPSRAGATNRAYGARSRRNRTAGGPRRGPAPGPRPGAGAGDADRPPNKASLGSTSYDGIDAEAFEPDWGGASWYGTTSGTFWTINPKEYADPRKHGPEYQARARRRRTKDTSELDETTPAPIDATDQPAGTTTDEPATAATDPTAAGGSTDTTRSTGASDASTAPEDGPTAPTANHPTDRGPRTSGQRSSPRPTHTTASWWEATAGPQPGDIRREPPPAPATARAPADAATAGDPPLTADAALAAARSWLRDGRPGVIGRLGRAIFGWAPVALAIGWAGGEISGCGRFSADCDPAVAPISWLGQLVVLLALLAVPLLARIAAVATVATIAAAMSGALLLSATGSPDDAVTGRAALGGLIAIAWAVGAAIAVGREVRRPPRSRPVS